VQHFDWLEAAIRQTHPLIRSWYDLETLRQNWLEDVTRDTEEFFSDAFADRFSRSCEALKLEAAQFKHRRLEVAGKALIAGIRFFSMDLSRPFVEVARLSEPLASDLERDEITNALREAFAVFNPRCWRVYQSAHLEYQFSGCDGDKRYLMGLLRDLNAQPDPPNFERVTLRRAENLEFYPRYEAMYEVLLRERPWQRDVANAETLENMREYLERAWLFEIFVDNAWAGVTAATRGSDMGATGYYMLEIALDHTYRGQGLGVAVQRRLVRALEDRPGDALHGTIGAVNTPMRKTATRVGRVDVGGHYWVKFDV
jgi:GNAT superfamily N-acetyltransferase